MNNENSKFNFALKKASYRDVEDCFRAFNRAYPTEDDCMVALIEAAAFDANSGRLESSGTSLYSCRACGRDDVEKINRGRAVKCLSCGKKTWLTAGTFFEKIRSARPYLACIWFLSHGISVSSETFHLLIGVAQSTAWNIARKVSMVLEDRLMNIESVVPAVEFYPAIRKRSIDTPARQSPKIDLTANDSDASLSFPDNRSQFTTDLNIGAHEASVLSVLSQVPAHVDEIAQACNIPVHQVLSAMTMLELEGLVQRLPGERYVSTVSKSRPANFIERTPEVVSLIGTFIEFFDDVYIGISGRYLQSCVARAWVLALNRLWPLKRLISLISSSGPLKMAQILETAPKKEIGLFLHLPYQHP